MDHPLSRPIRVIAGNRERSLPTPELSGHTSNIFVCVSCDAGIFEGFDSLFADSFDHCTILRQVFIQGCSLASIAQQDDGKLA